MPSAHIIPFPDPPTLVEVVEFARLIEELRKIMAETDSEKKIK